MRVAYLESPLKTASIRAF